MSNDALLGLEIIGLERAAEICHRLSNEPYTDDFCCGASTAEKLILKCVNLLSGSEAEILEAEKREKSVYQEYSALLERQLEIQNKQIGALVRRGGWVGLTVNEKLYSNSNYLGKSAEAWHAGVAWAEAKLKDKNT